MNLKYLQRVRSHHFFQQALRLKPHHPRHLLLPRHPLLRFRSLLIQTHLLPRLHHRRHLHRLLR